MPYCVRIGILGDGPFAPQEGPLADLGLRPPRVALPAASYTVYHTLKHSTNVFINVADHGYERKVDKIMSVAARVHGLRSNLSGAA